MSELCYVEMCKSLSRAQCICCNKTFCRNHFLEHDSLPSLELNSLVDEINLVNDRLTSFNIDKLIGNSYQQLEGWRASFHKMIDQVYEKKCQEIDQRAKDKVDEQRDEIHRVRTVIDEHTRKQEPTMKDIDLLKGKIHTIKEKLNKMENTCFQVVIRPFAVDDSLLHIEELYLSQLDLRTLPPPYKTIDRVDNSSHIIASNGQFFLLHQDSGLCLMDRELTIFKKIPWDYGSINDMCWSSTLSRFFVVTKTNVYIIDDNIMLIECLKLSESKIWYSCTCSDTNFYLSTGNIGSKIFQFRLFPSIKFKKQWTSPETCEMGQLISKIAYNNEQLAFSIFDMSKSEKLIELRSSINFERRWSLRLNVEYNIDIYWCCSLNSRDWLIWDSQTSSLLHITNDGKLQTTTKYNEHPYFVCIHDGNKMVIATEERIHLHELKCVQ